MASPTETSTTATEIVVGWTAVADANNGGDTITMYHLYWDNAAAGTYVEQ
jgi:hypothetical protein